MAAAPGIVTSGTGPPNAVVQVQPGMQVQPDVLVDQNGNYLTGSGSAATAGYLADLTGSVNVAASAAPSTGQVLTATSGTTATWQASQSGFANPMTTGGDTLFESGALTPARLAGNTAGTKNFLTSTGSGGTANAPAWGTIAAGDVPVLNQNTAGTAAAANALATASGSVSVSAAAAPAANQVLTATSGTTATWQNGVEAVLTTLGDTLFENATPAAARLAGNTTTQKLFMSQTGNGTVSAAPAWSAVSGQYVCPPTMYAPGTLVTLSTSSASMTAVSSANVNTGSFTASGGTVVVTASLVTTHGSSGDFLTFGLANHGGTVPVCNNNITQCISALKPLPYVLQFMVTSLTAGSAYTFDLMFCTEAGTLNVYAVGNSAGTALSAGGGPVIMTVQAV